jgi:predicted nucleic acid-binding protein
MSKVFWDSMLFIHLVEDHADYAPVVLKLLERCSERGDTLYTSHLSIAETLVGIADGSAKEKVFLSTLNELAFRFVDFGGTAVQPFRVLRAQHGLKPPDAMNLACASALRCDMYLTGDKQLLKKHLHVPGIHFIVNFESAPL